MSKKRDLERPIATSIRRKIKARVGWRRWLMTAGKTVRVPSAKQGLSEGCILAPPYPDTTSGVPNESLNISVSAVQL